MKTIPLVLLVIMFGATGLTEASAKDEGAVLCRMLESSLSNPWKFDTVVAEESKQFGNTTNSFIQSRINQLTTQAKQREAVCEPYKNKSMGYDLCVGNNPARELATWLDSVSQAVRGSKWEQTEYGEGQLKVWNSCNNPALCEQLRLAAAIESRQVCPSWLGNE